MRERTYTIHGVDVRLSTDHWGVAEAAALLLRHFTQVRETRKDDPDAECVVEAVRDRSEIPVRPSASARVLFSKATPDPNGWTHTLYRDAGRTVADFDELGVLVIDQDRLRVDVYVVEPDRRPLEILLGLLLMAVTGLLRRTGLYTLHATALARDGRGVLISAPSGRGKTTSCLALLRAGYRFLSDDHPFLRDDARGPRVLSFPVKVDVTDRTVRFFPELQAASALLRPGLFKRHFYVDEVYGDVVVDSCDPAVILLPQVTDCPTSRAEPLPRSRALEALLPEALLVLDRAVARRHFALMGRLVETAACYRLHFGRNVLELPRLVDRLLGVA
jgi:hypothetical protein